MATDLPDELLFADLSIQDKIAEDKSALDGASRAKPKLQRDSLAQRLSPGKPGSRRHQRFLNQLYLTAGSEGEVELEWQVPVEFRSPFSVLFENPVVMNKWEDFIDITEGQQKALLNYYCPSHPTKKHAGSSIPLAPPLSPHERFLKIQSVASRMLRTNYDSPSLVTIEAEIVKYLTSTTAPSMKMSFPSGFHRIIARGICAYYGLRTKTALSPKVGEAEEKMVMVFRPAVVVMPSVPLVEYLQEVVGQPRGL